MWQTTKIIPSHKVIDKILISTLVLEVGIMNVAQVISNHIGNRPITVIPILTGGMFYATSLLRHLTMPVQIWPIACSSYGGTTRAISSPKLLTPIAEHKLRFENVLIVDDIFDTGVTMTTITKNIMKLKPKKIVTTTLLKKTASPSIGLDIAAFTIPDVFVIGYGLDYQGLFRNLPFVATMKKEYINAK